MIYSSYTTRACFGTVYFTLQMQETLLKDNRQWTSVKDRHVEGLKVSTSTGTSTGAEFLVTKIRTCCHLTPASSTGILQYRYLPVSNVSFSYSLGEIYSGKTKIKKSFASFLALV